MMTMYFYNPNSKIFAYTLTVQYHKFYTTLTDNIANPKQTRSFVSGTIDTFNHSKIKITV